MKFGGLAELKEEAKLTPELVDKMMQSKKATFMYEKVKLLYNHAAGGKDNSEEVYVLYSRCIHISKLMLKCPDFKEFSDSDESKRFREIVSRSLAEFDRLENELKSEYARIEEEKLKSQKVNESTKQEIHPVDQEDFGNFIDPAQLVDYLKTFDKTCLVLDYRFKKKVSGISFEDHELIQTLPLNPTLFQPEMVFTQLRRCVDLRYCTTIPEIQDFDLIVLMGDELEDRNSMPFKRGATTKLLWDALTLYRFDNQLKRNPLLLEGGFKAWKNAYPECIEDLNLLEVDENLEQCNDIDSEQLNSKFSSLNVNNSSVLQFPAASNVSSIYTNSNDLPPLIDRSKKPRILDEAQKQHLFTIFQAYERSVHLIESSAFGLSTPPGYTGLFNRGNTCFVNSTLQALFNTPGMHELFTKKQFVNYVNPKNRSKSAGAISACFSALMDSYWSGRFKQINPEHFLSVFSTELKFDLSNRRNNDAQESLFYLRDALHDETDRVDNRRQFDQKYDEIDIRRQAEEYIRNSSLFESSPVYDLFSMTNVGTMTCMNCGASYVRFENSTAVLLDLPADDYPYCTLNGCLNQHFGDSLMEGWTCSTCKNMRVKRSIRIWSFPPVLVICLKRFVLMGDKSVKKNINVNFNINSLDMSQFRHKNSNTTGLGPRYELYAITNHAGTLDVGHFSSIVRNEKTNQWLMFDDERVFQMDPSKIQGTSAYTLYFRNTSSV